MLRFLLLVWLGLSQTSLIYGQGDSLIKPQALFGPNLINASPESSNPSLDPQALDWLKLSRDTLKFENSFRDWHFWLNAHPYLYALQTPYQKISWTAEASPQGAAFLRGLDADGDGQADQFQVYEKQWTEQELEILILVNQRFWIWGHCKEENCQLKYDQNFQPSQELQTYLQSDWRLWYRQYLRQSLNLDDGLVLCFSEEDPQDPSLSASLAWYWLGKNQKQALSLGKMHQTQVCYNQEAYLLNSPHYLSFANEEGIFLLELKSNQVQRLEEPEVKTKISYFDDPITQVRDTIINQSSEFAALSCWSRSPNGSKIALAWERGFIIFWLDEQGYPKAKRKFNLPQCRGYCSDQWSGIPEIGFLDEEHLFYYPRPLFESQEVLCDCLQEVSPRSLKIK